MANPIFEFQVEDNTLSVEVCQFGKEIVFLNGKVVKTIRELRFRTSHTIEIDGVDYTIETHVANLFTGKIHCSLLRGGSPVEFKHTKATLGEKNKYLSMVLLLSFCGLLGYFVPKMGPWVWVSPILFVLCVVTAMAGRERIYHVHTKKT